MSIAYKKDIHNSCQNICKKWAHNIYAPSHEIMVLFILRKLILQTCMRSHPVGARCLIFGCTFRLLPYFMCANSEGSGETVSTGVRRVSTEPSLVAYVISTIISWAGSNGVGGYRGVSFFFLPPPSLSPFSPFSLPFCLPSPSSFSPFSLPLLPLHSPFLLCLPSPMSHLPPPFSRPPCIPDHIWAIEKQNLYKEMNMHRLKDWN